MTESEERRQIAQNAKKALADGEITKQQYNDVRVMLMQDYIEKKELVKYQERKQG